MIKYDSLESIPLAIRDFFIQEVNKEPIMVEETFTNEQGVKDTRLVHGTVIKLVDGNAVNTKQYKEVISYVEKERTNLKSTNALASVIATGNHKLIYDALGKNAESNQWMFFDKYINWLKSKPVNGSEVAIRNWEDKRPYNSARKPKDVQDEYLRKMLSIRLDELKALRNKASAKGFIYDGHTIIADRDAQNDLANIYNQYLVGIKDTNTPTYYKTNTNTYLVLLGGNDTFELLKAVSKFIESDCFAEEARVAKLLSNLDPVELLTINLSNIFYCDHTTDRKVLPEQGNESTDVTEPQATEES